METVVVIETGKRDIIKEFKVAQLEILGQGEVEIFDIALQVEVFYILI
jgi:hypothetical protein